MAVVVQDCKEAGAAEVNDRGRHHSGGLLPIMWSTGSEFMQRIAVFQRAEPGSNGPCVALQPCFTTMTSLAGIATPISTFAEMPKIWLPTISKDRCKISYRRAACNASGQVRFEIEDS
jgi:hypothetical protein